MNSGGTVVVAGGVGKGAVVVNVFGPGVPADDLRLAAQSAGAVKRGVVVHRQRGEATGGQDVGNFFDPCGLDVDATQHARDTTSINRAVAVVIHRVAEAVIFLVT